MRALIGIVHALEMPGMLTACVQFLDEPFVGHPGPPLIDGLEVDNGLEHLERRGVGGGVGTTGLTEHAGHLRHLLDQPVLQLQQFARLGHGHARQRGGHVEQCPLIERRHELAAELARRPYRCQQCQHRRGNDRLGVTHDLRDDRTIALHQHAVYEITLFRDDLAAHEQQHQHRHQRHRQERRAEHGEGLRVCQRREQAAFLRLERKDRQERHWR